MANAICGWNNRINSSSLTVSSSQPGMDVSQLQNAQGSSSTAWQTTTASYGGLRLDSGSDATTWRGLGLFRTNLTSGATIRWRISSDVNANNIFWDTGLVSAGIVAGYGQSVTVLPYQVTGRYCFVEIVDTANPDGFLNIPLVYAGPVWQPLTNINFDSSVGRDEQTDEVTTRGGSEYPVAQYSRRRWDVTLAGIRQAELWSQAGELDRYARSGNNTLFVPDPAGAVSQEAIYGRCRVMSDFSFTSGSADRRSWKIRFTERL